MGRTVQPSRTRDETRKMSFRVGQFVECSANDLGVGKLLAVTSDIATIEYFESPTKEKRPQISVPLAALRFVSLEPDLPPLNESASGARILVLGRHRRRSDNATREEVFCGADYRQAA